MTQSGPGSTPNKCTQDKQTHLANLPEEAEEIKNIVTSLASTTAKLVSVAKKLLDKIRSQSSDEDKTKVPTPTDTKYSNLAKEILYNNKRMHEEIERPLSTWKV